MSYTARPPFAGGMSNQNQQQQQGGQPNNSNIGASGIPNMPMMNNAVSTPGNHLTNPGSSSVMSVIDQKIFQQQLLLQSQLLMQGQPFQQQQQPSQPNQQAKFHQQTNQTQALNRIVSEMLTEKNGSNLAQQQQQLQQIAQIHALTNMMQLQQVVQQKSFQQQSVPLPTNTTITPVARQNMQSMQKQPANYPRSNVQNKNQQQNVGSSPMQSRKSFPNAPKSAVPQMQSGMVATPLNIPSNLSKSTIPQMPSAMASSANVSKGYADLLAATLSNSPTSMNITPSLTITKTNSPSSSAAYGKSSGGMPNKPVSTSAASQKSFLPEAISMSLGNVPISVKSSQPPSVTVTPTTKPTSSPTNKSIPATPFKTNSPQNMPALQKLSPTSPRTKQTPRKNMNPIRTTSLSPATQTSSQSAVPHVDAKVTSPLVSLNASAVKTTQSPPTAVANASSVKPFNAKVTPPAAPRATAQVPIASAPPAPAKPIPPVSQNNSNAIDTKTSIATIPKLETQSVSKAIVGPTVTVKSECADKVIKTEPVKTEKPAISDKTIKSETVTAVKVEKPATAPATPATAVQKTPESKSKQNTSPQNATPLQSNSNQSALSEKKENKETNVAKIVGEQVNKTPVAKLVKASQSSTPVPSSAETRAKRNRWKTIPYQSPTPEFELVSKISAHEAINAHKKKVDEDKLTLFYKSEFLAVRNADGGFYLCQAMNNVYKSSPKIRIRWLSEEPANKNIYALDFYDTTDIECVLTSVSLNKMPKGKLELTKTEHDRIENILKKALDVEKGIVERPDVNEENPDGLDLSLYTDESQIEKKASSSKRKSSDDSVKKAPASKKRKAETSMKTPAKKAKEDDKTNSASKSAKKTPAKQKKVDESICESTPSTKRSATKRKLVDETSEVQNTDEKDSINDAEEAKEAASEVKVSKSESESPKQSSEKATSAVDSAGQSGRPTRRSKN